MNYKLDKNGKFSEDNALIRSIDEWYDKDEFENIVNGILEVPRGIWSTKLRRNLISAYNNLGRFDDAWRELAELKPLCDTPALTAVYHYFCGYIYYRLDKDMMAISCFNEGKAADPEDKGKLGFDAFIEDCRGYVENDLKKLGRLAERINSDIREKCSQTPESEKEELSEEDFTIYLGFLFGMRTIPGMDRAIGFGKYFRKFEGSDRECVLEFFERTYKVHDRESFREFFTGYGGINLSDLYNAIPPYLAGKPEFDVDELSGAAREAFMNSAEFMEPFAQYLPKAGVLAWDISEKVGFARLAYSCDLIGNTDYCTIMLALTDLARENFSSFEEYLLSLAFGCGVLMFHIDQWSIKSAIEFINNMMPLLLHGDLPKLKWKEKED